MAEFLIAEPRPAMRAGAAAAAGAANVTSVSIQVTRVDGKPTPFLGNVWLSDAASGAGLTAVTATGGVAVGASGVILQAITAAKLFLVQTTAAGLLILTITDTAKTPFVVCIEVEGRTYPLLTLATANYG